ncbi:hypothetical protein [Streptomyces sp. ISL-86]|uniref:hypothetical protein n=1 Tax=Streptomyces sp. ISL-86 TaxID=2819187 RepID=UPI001BEA22E5|nr:hypothetical protein [Streptomyces sp. ISL-86]MBT2453245.1 hypothetical protein [Streptomyces sp. ISL-86]
MLSAAEASIDAAAEDDNERARNRAKLWAPPKGRTLQDRRVRTPGMRMEQSQAQAMAARLAAEDARLGAE